MKHYQTEEEAIAALPPHTSVYQFVGDVLTVAVISDWGGDVPHILLREQEGLYWQEPDKVIQ